MRKPTLRANSPVYDSRVMKGVVEHSRPIDRWLRGGNSLAKNSHEHGFSKLSMLEMSSV